MQIRLGALGADSLKNNWALMTYVPERRFARDSDGKKVIENGIFAVQAILGEVCVGSVCYFKVQWQGFGEDEATWEPSHNLNCPELIQQFRMCFQLRTILKTLFTVYRHPISSGA
jgi:hypothetical protein